MSSLILLLVSSAMWLSDASMNQATGGRLDKDTKEAIRYLSKFGYLETNKSPLISSANRKHNQTTSIRNAIIKFQEFAGLKSSGELDEPTKYKMQQRRCGVPDIATPRLLGSGKWSKRNLKYSIVNFPVRPKRESVRRVLNKAFKIWSSVSNLNFKAQNGSDVNDIVVGFFRGDHNDGSPFDGPGGILAHAFYPPGGLLHFDLEENWTRGKPNAPLKNNACDLLYVAVHEIGHLLGLHHSNDSESIMAPFYQAKESNDGMYLLPKLAESDIRNIQDLYGVPNRRKKINK